MHHTNMYHLAYLVPLLVFVVYYPVQQSYCMQSQTFNWTLEKIQHQPV